MLNVKQKKKLKDFSTGKSLAKDTSKLLDTKSKKDERKKRSRMRHRQRGIKWKL